MRGATGTGGECDTETQRSPAEHGGAQRPTLTAELSHTASPLVRRSITRAAWKAEHASVSLCASPSTSAASRVLRAFAFSLLLHPAQPRQFGAHRRELRAHVVPRDLHLDHADFVAAHGGADGAVELA